MNNRRKQTTTLCSGNLRGFTFKRPIGPRGLDARTINLQPSPFNLPGPPTTSHSEGTICDSLIDCEMWLMDGQIVRILTLVKFRSGLQTAQASAANLIEIVVTRLKGVDWFVWSAATACGLQSVVGYGIAPLVYCVCQISSNPVCEPGITFFSSYHVHLLFTNKRLNAGKKNFFYYQRSI